MRNIYFSLACLVLGMAAVRAYNHPELVWKTYEGVHFVVHYHQGTELTAYQTYLIAESIYGPMTRAYNWRPPDKVHILIRDHDDIANGASFTHGNMIEIWATSLNTEMRGTYQWLKCVITHEFAHTISRGKALRLPPWLYAFVVQGHQYFKNPDIRVELPYATDMIPEWFSEGIAQFEDDVLGYDAWDSQRDMALRRAFLDSTVLDFTDMEYFDKNGLEWEMVYNQGYSLTGFISRRYGHEAVAQLVDYSGQTWGFSFDSALKAILGKAPADVYGEWYGYYSARYDSVRKAVEADSLVEGDTLFNRGMGDYFAAWSPDGKKRVYISAGGSSYMLYGLYLHDLEKDKTKFLKGGMGSLVCWSADSKTLYYAKMDKADRYGSNFNDLYRYTLENKKEKRLTRGLRATYPDLSPDGTKVVFVRNCDGTHNLGVLDLATDSVSYLTDSPFGTQWYTPRWSPDGSLIAVSVFTGDDRDLMLMLPDGKGTVRVIASPHDDRDPYWSPDGKKLYFASDRTGIFNIYAYDLDSRQVTQHTNVLGGAFNPSLSPAGDTLSFASYTGQGFMLNKLALGPGRPVTGTVKESLVTRQAVTGNLTFEDFKGRSQPYRRITPTLHLVPFASIDDSKLKLGSELFGSDVVGQQGLQADVSVGQEYDLDANLHYELNKFLPSAFFDFFYVKRHYNNATPFYQHVYDNTNEFIVDSLVGDVSFQFDLYQANLGLNYLINNSQLVYLLYTYKNFNYNYQIRIPGRLMMQSSNINYLSGHNLNLFWIYFGMAPATDGEINPTGLQTVASYALCADATWDTLHVEEEGESVYDTIVYNRFELYQRLAWPLPFGRHVLDLECSAGLIDKPIHSYFSYYINFLVGGLGSMRSVPMYSLEGNRMLWGRATYRFPIWRHINKRFLSFHFVRLYGGWFFEIGNAWNGGTFDYLGYQKWHIPWGDMIKGAGLELRLDGVSFYSYPLKVYFSVAGLLDKLPADQDERVYKDDDDQDRIRSYLGIGFTY